MQQFDSQPQHHGIKAYGKFLTLWS